MRGRDIRWVGILAVACAALLVLFRPGCAKREAAVAGQESSVPTPATSSAGETDSTSRLQDRASPLAPPPDSGIAGIPVDPPTPIVGGTAREDDAAVVEDDARAQAIEAWDALVDQMAGLENVDDATEGKRIKEAFDRLHPADRMDAIQQALNLFEDDTFPVLYSILFDKRQAPEVLDAIFSDALNRPDEIKVPLMEELRKDREHPCFFESARILDVIGDGSAETAEEDI